MLFCLFAMSLASGGYFWVKQYFETIEEVLLEQKNQTLKIEWEILHQRVEKANEKLAAFIDKDDNNYRVILDTSPLDPTIREAGVGGSERIDYKILQDFPSILQEYTTIEKIKHQLDVEIQSYEEINKLLDRKMAMWAAKPAIQPLSNEDLTYLHMRYGQRFHQILGRVRDHKGLDFSADIGTPIYATGDGKIEKVYVSESFGKVIFINHKFGYETRYAHLSKFHVKEGQTVKRGQLIGLVGSTGLSAGPHLHYEVLFQGEHINPINFFQRDLNNAEYEKLIDLAAHSEALQDQPTSN
jgi:murein DD-endopeptidase MepM/ murein hydrolase activator NlpD